MFKQHGTKKIKTWQIRFLSSTDETKKQETVPVERELTADFAQTVAEINNYDSFEIIETTTTVKKYSKE